MNSTECDTTSQTIAEARLGSTQALGRLFEQSRPFLLRAARACLGPGLSSKGDPSDIVQETFLEAQRDFAAFHGTTQQELHSWLRHRLRFRVLKFVRNFHGTAKRASLREVPLEHELARPERIPPMLVDRHAPPIDVLITAERDLRIRRAIERLPRENQRLISLRTREGLTFEEIGFALGRTTNATRKLWIRSIRELIESLNETNR